MNVIKQLVETAKSALFICSICQENIQNPVLLPCNHSFCGICLKKYLCSSPVKNNKLANCPNCSKAVTRRSSYSAPDIEGQLFQELITLLEAETGVDLTDVCAKDVPVANYDKQRYIREKKENIVSTHNQKSKKSNDNSKNPETTTKVGIRRRSPSISISISDKLLESETAINVVHTTTGVSLIEKNSTTNDSNKNIKQLNSPEIHNEKTTKLIKSANRKRTLSGSEKNSVKKRAKSENENVENKNSSSKTKMSSETRKNVKHVAESSLKKKDISIVGNGISEISKNNHTGIFSDSSSIASIHHWGGVNEKALKTYKRKHKPLPIPIDDNEDAQNSVEKVEQWLENLPSVIIERSKSLTPIKKSKSTFTKNKSLNEIVKKSTTTEIARNLESKILNDLLELADPKPNNSMDNWTRVKKEFRTRKFKKLDLSIVKSTKRKSGGNKKSLDNVSNDNKLKMNPRVVLEKFEGFKIEEQVSAELNKKEFLSISENLSNSLLKSSKLLIDLIDQITTHILNENVQFQSFFIFKECVNSSKKLRELCNLKNIETANQSKLSRKEVGINTENYENICSKCHIENLNELIDLTQKIIPTDNALHSTQRSNKSKLNHTRSNQSFTIGTQSTQRSNKNQLHHESNQSSLKRQISGDIFIETENENPDKVVENDCYNSNSESSLKFYTPKSESNISKFIQDIIYENNEMDFTQTLPSREITSDSKLKDKIDNSQNILSNDDEDIINGTPKSNKSESRVKSPITVFNQQLQSQKRKIESDSEVSEHPSIILGTEYTQKVSKQIKLKKRKSNIDNDENKLDVTLIEPIETQTPSSIPVLENLPPPTEFMDTEEEDNEEKSKRNNLNNFSALPEATMLKNIKTPAADINIERLKDGPILSEIPGNGGPVTSIESVIEQTPLSCYPPKSRINLSNTKAFKQISMEVSSSDSEPEENPLELIKDDTPRRLYTGSSKSKQISMLSYVNASQEKHRKLSESQSSAKKLSTSTRMNPPSLPVSMSSSQRKIDLMNKSFKSQFDTPTTQSFARPMASSTPSRPGNKSFALHRLRAQHNMVIFWTRLSVSQISLLTDFCKQFNIKFTTDNTDTTTHLITRVDENNAVEDYTLKYVCAVSRGIWVLSFKWIEDCLDSNKILPEEPYEALDSNGNTGPRMSRLRERTSILLEKFAVCVVSSPATFPKDKLINCILQNGGKIYDSVEDLAACQDGKIRLIITDTPETQDAIAFQDYFERFGILSIVTEWVFNTIATFKVDSLATYLMCTITDVVPKEYPHELLIESEVTCDSITFDG